MRQPCRHPKLLNLACRVYAAVIWTYPAELRRAFGRELRVTFRNRAEDVLQHPTPASILEFAVHIGADWARTVATEPTEPVPVSLLGLAGTELDAAGCLDRSTMSVGLLLATLGVFLMISGWYGWLNHEATFLSRYSYSTIPAGPHQPGVRVLMPRHPQEPSQQTPRR
jgi:hypothetical protein